MRFVRMSTPVLASAMAVVASTLLLRAQNAPPTTRPDPGGIAAAQPLDAPPPPATQPSTGPTTGPATHPVQEISLNFKDVPVDTILDYFSDKAGFIVIKEAPVEGRVTVQSRKPVSPEEAVALLGAVLRGTGHTAVQDGRVLKIMSSERAKKGNLPVQFGADPALIEATEALITQVIPIRNIDASKLKTDLAPLIGTEADVTANDASNAIIITDVSSRIRRIVQIINTLDNKDVAATDLRLVHLKHADASATAKLLTAIFKAEAGAAAIDPRMAQQMREQGQPVPQKQERVGRVPGGAIDQALHGGHVNAVSDDRTNTLIITAPTDTLKVIDDIIKDLDSDPVAVTELQAFPLKHGDAEATAKLLNNMFKGEEKPMIDPYYSRFMPQEDKSKVKVNATFDDRTNSVIVSAPADTMKGIAGLIKELDSDTAAIAELRVFQLKYSDAFDAAKLIKDVFNPETKDSKESPLRYLFYGSTPPSSQKNVKVLASSDDRTNTLVITAPTELLKPIEALVKQLDSNPASEEALFIYRLRNAQSANLEYVLNSLFGTNNVQGNQPGNQQQQGQENGQQQNSFGSRSSRSLTNNQGGGTGIGATRSNKNGNRNSRQNLPQLPPGMARAVTELSGEVSVVAEQDTNSLVVVTKAKYEDQVRQIIEELDRPVAQVLIKVLVAEVTHENSADFGVDFSVLNKRPSGNGQSFASNFGNAAAASNGGLVVSLVETNVNATLHALAVEGKLDVLSRPYILASDNQQASITVGQEVPFITDTRITDTGQTINSIQYQDIGIIVHVTPHINPEGLVVLDVSPEISQLTGTSVPIGNNVSAPVIAKRSAESRVNVKNGQTIVIGGLMEDRKTSTVNKVPIMGDLPLLGPIFSRTQMDKTKTELLIFLTPHVALQPETLGPMSEDETSGTRLTTRAIAPGVFEQHMRGMHRGDTHELATQPSEPVRHIEAPPPPPGTRPAQPGRISPN